MQYLYTFLFYLALPWVFLRLLWRSYREPAYRARWSERLGFYAFQFDRCLWVHAVSVGEVIAAIPLVQQLQKEYPDLPLLVTTMTPTGAMRVQAALGNSVTHAYLPYDLPYAMRRFLRAANPLLAMMMETEMWPNLFTACAAARIPICLLNARLSARSARGYRFVLRLTRAMLAQITFIAANATADAERFIALGADRSRVSVTGNIKFDLVVPASLATDSQMLRAQLGVQRFIWVAASTHAGEEEMILAAHHALLRQQPNALLILVPRHQSRFAEIAKLTARDFVLVRRSQENSAAQCQTAQVFLGDSMGELMLFYSVADVVFVGGSLIPRGGHNFVEPATLSKPILIGPHVFNFAEMYAGFVAGAGLYSVQDQQELIAALLILAVDATKREALGRHALAVVSANRGALARQLSLVRAMMARNDAASSLRR